MRKFFSLRRYEYLLLVIMIAISTSFVLFSLKQIKKDSIKTVEMLLLSINTSCHEALVQWLHFREENIKELSENSFLVESTVALLQLESDSTTLLSSGVTSDLRKFFKPILSANEDLGVFLISPEYISIFSMRNANTGELNLTAKQSKPLLDEVLLKGETVLIPPIHSDVALQSKYSGRSWHTMFIATPIVYKDKIIAAFLLRLDSHKDFSRILEIGRIGQTGETVGFDRSGKIVTSSRFESSLKESGILDGGEEEITTSQISYLTNDTLLSNNKISDFVLSNNYNVTEMRDFRGEKVFVVHIWDDDLNIGITTKMDIAEALREYYFLRKILIILFFSIIIIGFFIIGVIVSLRQRAEDLLQDANQLLETKVAARTFELEQTIKTKDNFFSILAHDLRSPFTGLLGLFDLLLDDPDSISESEKNRMMRQVYNSSERLFKLLENLLNWSRSQTGNIKINPVKLLLFDLVEANINLQKQHAKNKNITLKNEVSEEVSVYADRDTVETVLRNLISNAVKFTKSGGSVAVGASIGNNIVSLYVQDSGVGISAENIKKLFKIDEKVSTKGTGDESGTGLGLILCKEFVELNAGKILVESQVGVGSKFIVELPHIEEKGEKENL